VSEIRGVNDFAEAAFRDHYERILRFVRQRTHSEAEAEDIAQTVFAEAAAKLEDFKPGATPVLAWLYTVAQRRLIDGARERTRRGNTVSLAAVEELAASPQYGSELGEALGKALEALPAEHGRVLRMRLIQGRSFAEIGTRIGCTEAAAKMRFARGLSAIRADLEREGITP
jgi:RNA polymerase sigma-70 factor (ECF subfamily)